MRVLALDVGDRHIGVAVSDELGLTGQPLPPLRNNVRTWEDLQKILLSFGVECIVLGMPFQMNGKIGTQAEKVLAWCEELRRHTDLPVVWVDERLSTRAAERTLLEGDVRRSKRKQVIDSMAAVLILQSYLERKRKEGDQDDGISR